MSKPSPGLAACVLLAGLLTAAAWAQAPAPTAGADGDAIPPPPDCQKPELPGNKLDAGASPMQIEHFNKKVERFNIDFSSYRQCVQIYVDARNAATRHYNDLAGKNAAAAQVEIDEINKLAAAAKQLSSGDDDSDSPGSPNTPSPTNKH